MNTQQKVSIIYQMTHYNTSDKYERWAKCPNSLVPFLESKESVEIDGKMLEISFCYSRVIPSNAKTEESNILIVVLGTNFDWAPNEKWRKIDNQS